MADAVLHLRPGRDRSLRRRHPWVFSGAVARVTGDPAPGATVLVRNADGEALGRAAYSPASQIRARMWSFDSDEHVDDDLMAQRVWAAAEARRTLYATTDAVRLVHGESDGLPGVVADRYGAVVVVQFTSAGAERWRDALVDALADLPGVATVFERSDTDGRAKEGLAPSTGLLAGDEPAPLVEVREQAPCDGGGARIGLDPTWRFAVDVRHGHKTGFYLDQRDSRAAVARLAAGRRTLNLFAYSGAFTVAARWAGAASVTSVDSSGPALALAADTLHRNGFEAGGLVEADVFADLRRRRDGREQWDLIVCDPPKLAASEAQVPRASRAYKDVNLLALKLLAPGGILVTFSCSGAVGEDLFTKIVAGAALDAGRDAQVVGRLSQPPDHPVALAFPEGAYLKGLVIRVP